MRGGLNVPDSLLSAANGISRFSIENGFNLGESRHSPGKMCFEQMLCGIDLEKNTGSGGGSNADLGVMNPTL